MNRWIAEAIETATGPRQRTTARSRKRRRYDIQVAGSGHPAFQFVTADSPAQEGQAIVVRLVNRNLDLDPATGNREVDFDDVRIDASPVAAMPFGDGFPLALAGALGFVGWRATRRARRSCLVPEARAARG